MLGDGAKDRLQRVRIAGGDVQLGTAGHGYSHIGGGHQGDVGECRRIGTCRSMLALSQLFASSIERRGANTFLLAEADDGQSGGLKPSQPLLPRENFFGIGRTSHRDLQGERNGNDQPVSLAHPSRVALERAHLQIALSYSAALKRLATMIL